MDARITKQDVAQKLSRLKQADLLYGHKPDTGVEVLLTRGWLMNDKHKVFNEQPIQGIEKGMKLDLQLEDTVMYSFKPSHGAMCEIKEQKPVAYLKSRRIAYAWPLEETIVVNLMRAGKKVTAEITSVDTRKVLQKNSSGYIEAFPQSVFIVGVVFCMEQ